MIKKVVTISAGSLTCVFCLLSAVTTLWPNFLVQYGQPQFLRVGDLQQYAQSLACQTYTIVPGSYHADPIRVSGDLLLATYSAECATSGQPGWFIYGYVAEDRLDNTCANAEITQPVLPARAGPVTITVGASMSWYWGATDVEVVVPGHITGPGAVTAQALFANGSVSSAAVQDDRFVIAALSRAAACSVRALDASGVVLAENRVNWPPDLATAGACP